VEYPEIAESVVKFKRAGDSTSVSFAYTKISKIPQSGLDPMQRASFPPKF